MGQAQDEKERRGGRSGLARPKGRGKAKKTDWACTKWAMELG